MNRFTMVAAIAATSAVFCTAAALAQSNDDFTRADGNNDGMITPIEAQGSYPSLTRPLFDMADTNHDGYLDETEWPLVAGLMGGNDHTHSSEPEEASSSEPPPPPV